MKNKKEFLVTLLVSIFFILTLVFMGCQSPIDDPDPGHTLTWGEVIC